MTSSTRRRFLQAAATTAATSAVGSVALSNPLLASAAPMVLTSRRSRQPSIVGSGAYTYEIEHDWPKLPDQYSWQTTHNVALDKAGNLYVIHEGLQHLKAHPAIFVFDPQGQFIKALGSQFQGGGHGLEIRDEDGTEFLYVAGYQQVKAIAKLDLNGETVWHRRAPMESGIYAPAEDRTTVANWGRDRFMPTNFAFLPDGDFLIADGYGSFCIHRYDKDGNWKSHFGGAGAGKGTFDTPHGIGFDGRVPEQPRIVVTDRAHHTLQFLTLDGEHLETVEGFGLPANADTWGELLLIPELHARLTILDKDNQVVARLGDDVARITGEGGGSIRQNPQVWQPNKFVHPHDACFDSAGNIFVAEWVNGGRISRLRRV